MTSKKEKLCERCGFQRASDTWEYETDYGEEKEMPVCSKCRHDLINNGRTFLNPSEAYQEQLERHKSDPLWEPHPDSLIGDEE